MNVIAYKVYPNTQASHTPEIEKFIYQDILTFHSSIAPIRPLRIDLKFDTYTISSFLILREVLR